MNEKKKMRYLFSTTHAITTARNSLAQSSRKSEEHLGSTDRPIETLSHGQMSWASQNNDVLYEILQNPRGIINSTSSVSNASIDSEKLWKLSDEDEQKRQNIIDSEWGGYALDIQLWNDISKNEETDLNKDELEFNSEEYHGILTDTMVDACKSFLTKSPEDGQYILGKCELRDMDLTDISTLRHHRHLQYLDLAHNNLSNLSPLGELPFLMYLDASHNKIEQMFEFSPSWYLTHVNLSYNQISEINDISGFWSILKLDLSHNRIEKIFGLQNLKYLKSLNLSYNYIECIENLDGLKIRELNLDYNCIITFKLSKTEITKSLFSYLRTLILCYNGISTVEFLKDAYSLKYLDLRHNQITDLLEISHLKNSIYEIDLRGNRCTKWSSYKNVMLHLLPALKYLDGSEVSVSEKVTAITLFDRPMNLLVAQSITKLYLLEQLSSPKINEHVIPYDQPIPPLIILCGPTAVEKMNLAIQAAEKLHKKIRYCRNHTTRTESNNEIEKKSYIFVERENFNEMTRRGEFLSVQELLGHSYGFHYTEIAQTIIEGKIGITQMDLNGTLQLQSRYPNIKTILVITEDEKLHRKWICEKFKIDPSMRNSLQDLLAVKIGSVPSIRNLESVSSTIHFITKIVNEVTDNLNGLQSYPHYDGNNETITVGTDRRKNVKQEKLTSKSEQEIKKRITFQPQYNSVISFSKDTCFLTEDEFEQSGLMIIMDEQSNVFDDETWKRNKQKDKILSYRNIRTSMKNDKLDEDCRSFASSEETLNPITYSKFEDSHLQEMFVEIVIKSRQIYIQQHQNEPGFFSLVLFPDDYIAAFTSLTNFIYQTYINHPLSKFTYSTELINMIQSAFPKKVQSLIEELE